MSNQANDWGDVDSRFIGVEPDALSQDGNADDGSDRAVAKFPLGQGSVVIDNDRDGLTAFVTARIEE